MNTTKTLALVCCAACAQSDANPENETTVPPYGVQIGGEGLHSGCTVQAIDPIADTSAVLDAVGMSADDALANLAGTFEGTATVYDGTGGAFTLVVGAPLEVSWVTEDGPEACDGFLYATVDFSVDGRSIVAAPLEGYATVVRLATDDRIETALQGAADIGDVEGTLDAQHFEVTYLVVAQLRLYATLGVDGYDGIDWFQGCHGGSYTGCEGSGEAPDLTFSVAR